MDRHTFWRLAQEALTEVLAECNIDREEIEETKRSMHWLAVENFDVWGIMFVNGKGATGFFSVYIPNNLNEEETKQMFKQYILQRYFSTNPSEF